MTSSRLRQRGSSSLRSKHCKGVENACYAHIYDVGKSSVLQLVLGEVYNGIEEGMRGAGYCRYSRSYYVRLEYHSEALALPVQHCARTKLR